MRSGRFTTVLIWGERYSLSGLECWYGRISLMLYLPSGYTLFQRAAEALGVAKTSTAHSGVTKRLELYDLRFVENRKS